MGSVILNLDMPEMTREGSIENEERSTIACPTYLPTYLIICNAYDENMCR